MNGCFPYLLIVGAGFLVFILIKANQTPTEREDDLHGPLNPLLVCPHCQTAGQVRLKPSPQKHGVSGSKATAALLTGGASLLAVGLSKTGTATQARCGKCQSGWTF